MTLSLAAFVGMFEQIENFSGKTLTDKMQDIYYDLLKDEISDADTDLILRAIAADSSIGRYRFPSVNELLAPLGKGMASEMDQAWNMVLAIARGAKQLREADRAIQDAIRSIGGAAALRGATDKDMHYFRKPFESAYRVKSAQIQYAEYSQLLSPTADSPALKSAE